MERGVDGHNSEIRLENNEESIKDLDRLEDQSTTISCSLDEESKEKSEEKIGSSGDINEIDSEVINDAGSNIQPKEFVNNVEDEMEVGDFNENDEFEGKSSSEYQSNTYLVGKPTTDKNPKDVEEDKLLLEKSEFVDAKCDRNVKMSFDLGNDKSSSSNVCNKYSANVIESSSETSISEENIECSVQVDDQLVVDNVTNVESIVSNSPNQNGSLFEVKNNDYKQMSATESALKKLASLGVIAEEKPTNIVLESKESVLHKLASRSAISITSAGGSLLPSSTIKSVTITPSQPKYKPGPKSAMMKQQAKKIKIDPGKSMDIDKDFSSLINILSTATERDSDELLDLENQNATNSDMVNVKYLDKSNAEVDKKNICNDVSEDKTMDVLERVENDAVHESDSESHDGNKSVSQGSDQAEEKDAIMSSVSYKLKNVIEEGSAEILLSTTKNVFYNKVQEFNRDMSIAALTVFSEMHQQDPRTRNRGKKRKAAEDISDNSERVDDNIFEPGKRTEHGIKILEALSATGLRSIRYAREIPGVKEITANDLSEDAVETIKKNIEHNGVEDMVTTTMSDASLLMYQQQTSQQWYDAIDLDPYGCPSRFLDSAVQAVRDGGLLLVTCTDMAVLAGNSPETCYVKYGAVSLRSPACHEMALRIALQCIESHTNRYGRYIVPLVSFSADFYIRLIVQIYTSPVTCKRTTSKLSMVYQCVGCQTHSLQPLGHMSQPGANSQPKFSLPGGPPVDINCFHCNHKHTMGGPIWSAPIYSSKFVESMLKVVENGRFATSKRMQGMLEVIREELPDIPLYYTIAGLCTRLHCQAIPLIDIRSAILNQGYRVSSSHAAPTAIKTNAPAKIIWDIMRCWVHMNPVSQKRLLPGSVPAAIILEPPTLIADFDIHPKARPSSSMRKLLRYQPNPEKNWGPGMRAKCNVSEDSLGEKSKMNQNKNKAKSGNKNIDIIEVVTIDDEDEITEDTSAAETLTTISSSIS